MTNQETDSVLKLEATPAENREPMHINLCQGYLVDPETKLHLCNACAYHKHRNQTKPWLK